MPKSPKMRIEVFPFRSRSPQKYSWRLRSRNGQVIANAAESFDSKANAKLAAKRIAKTLNDAFPVWEVNVDGEYVETLAEAAVDNVTPIAPASQPVPYQVAPPAGAPAPTQQPAVTVQPGVPLHPTPNHPD